MKNTFFITILWVLAGFILILVGAWREYLYRQSSDKKQDTIIELQGKIIDLQKLSNEKQSDMLKKISDLENKGEISHESAKKIIQIILSDSVSIKDEVKIKLSPSQNSSNSDELRNDVLKENKTTLTDKLEIKLFRKEDKQ